MDVASREFAENPIGAHFDPDQLVEARKDGLDFKEIHRNAQDGKYLPAGIPDVHLPELW